MCVCVRYLQVVDEQLIEGRVSVKVDQETLVIHHSDSRGLQGNSQTLQLPLTLLQETYCIFNTWTDLFIIPIFSCSMKEM